MTIRDNLRREEFTEGEVAELDIRFEDGFLDGLEDLEYPVAPDELLSEFGESEVRLAERTKTLREILILSSDWTFHSKEDIEQTILTFVYYGPLPLAGHDLDIPLVMCTECENYREARISDRQVVPLEKRCPWCESESYR